MSADLGLPMYSSVSDKVPLNPAIVQFPMKPSPLSFKTFEESDTDKWSCLSPCMPAEKVSESNHVWFKDPIVELGKSGIAMKGEAGGGGGN
jgi:hypothetical protein